VFLGVLLAGIVFADTVKAPLDNLALANDIVIQDNFISSLANRRGVDMNDLKTLVREYEIKYGLKGFYKTIECESNFNPNAIGDSGSSVGLLQIHLPAWPEITRTQALNPEWSLNWSIAIFKAHPENWSCYRKLSSSAPLLFIRRNVLY